MKINIFGCDCECKELLKNLLEIVEWQAQTIRNQSETIKNLTKPHGVKLSYSFKNNKNQKTMDVDLTLPGAPKTGTPSLVDIVTNQTIPNATFTNGIAVLSDPSVANVAVDAATGVATASPLAVGTTSVVITTETTWINNLGESVTQSTPSDPMNLVVTALPTADGVKLVYTWA